MKSKLLKTFTKLLITKPLLPNLTIFDNHKINYLNLDQETIFSQNDQLGYLDYHLIDRLQI